MTTLEIFRRDYIEARKNFDAAEKRYRQTESRLKEARARLLDLVCNGPSIAADAFAKVRECTGGEPRFGAPT